MIIANVDTGILRSSSEVETELHAHGWFTRLALEGAGSMTR